MGSNIKYWLNSGKEKRVRQSCYHRSSHYDETQYTLLEDYYDESRDGDYALHSRDTTSYYEKELEPGDTLRSLSLKFNCPVAELKRINGILQDNEVFARRSLKVPVKPGSVVTERLAGVHVSGSGTKDEDKLLISFDDSVPSDDDLSSSEDKLSSAKHHNILDDEKGQTANSTSLTPNSIDFLSNNTNADKILIQTVSSASAGSNGSTDSHPLTDVLNKTCREEASLGPLMLEDLPVVSTESVAVYRCNGADWGLKWPQLLIFSLLLGFAGPILYVLYVTDKQHKTPR